MKSPILMIVFCRPDTTDKVFESVRLARPPRLYVACDAPRLDRISDAGKCKQVVDIFDKVDWPCEVYFYKQKTNAGCSKGPFDAITWFFKNESEGIILEDDIVPIPDFYTFCDDMLQKYRDDLNVQSVSGWSYFYKGYPSHYIESYYFSRITSSWGWATWKRAWNDMDLKLENIQRDVIQKRLYSFGFPNRTVSFYLDKFDKIKVKYDSLKSWDYQFLFSMWNKNRFVVQPMCSLTKNIGVGDGATHSFSLELSNYPTKPIYPINHPDKDSVFLELEKLRIVNEKLFSDRFYKKKWIDIKHKIKILLIKLGMYGD